MENELLINILKKYNLKEGDKIDFESLTQICEQEQITLEELLLMLQINKHTIYKFKKNKQKTTKLKFNKYNNANLEDILKCGKINQESFERTRKNNQVKTYTLMRMLGISRYEYNKMKKEKMEYVKVLDIKKKYIVDMIKIDLKYTKGYGSRYYSEDELTKICHSKGIKLDDFLKYYNKNIKHYRLNKLIVENNKNGLWIGESIVMPNEFFNVNEEYMRSRLNKVVDKYNIIFRWKQCKDDLVQEGIFGIQQKGGSIVNNFSFDFKLLFNILIVKAKYIMINYFKKKNKERCISYDAYSHNEIDYMNIFGSEDYELVAFDNT